MFGTKKMETRLFLFPQKAAIIRKMLLQIFEDAKSVVLPE